MSKKSKVTAPSSTFPVQINKIRVPTADLYQRKFNKTWGDQLAAELDLNKLGHPVLNFRDGVYWCIDGQHRVYALKAHGFDQNNDTWPCEVFTNLTNAEQAEIFLDRNNGKRVTPFTKFTVSVGAERTREVAILRLVKEEGLKVSRSRSEGCIGAVGALGKVFDIAGELVLSQTLRTIRDSFAAQPDAFNRELLEGIGLVYSRYNGKTDEQALVKQLGHTPLGAAGVMRRAEARREQTGSPKVHCVAAVIVELYNKGVDPKKRLPSWWKKQTDEAQKG
jgi:hypothetical protein